MFIAFILFAPAVYKFYGFNYIVGNVLNLILLTLALNEISLTRSNGIKGIQYADENKFQRCLNCILKNTLDMESTMQLKIKKRRMDDGLIL